MSRMLAFAVLSWMSLMRIAVAADEALAPPVINLEPGSKYADATRLFQGIPGIERAANGRLWALWYAGGPDEPGEGPGNYTSLGRN